MFTGIVEEIGRVRSIARRGDMARLEIAAREITGGTRTGDSIAVNGVCQTVVALDEAAFAVEVLAETLGKTTLGKLRAGERVNLERSLCLGGRLGGHLVQGHVGGRARVAAVRDSGQNRWLTLALSAQLERYCVREGSIAIDGVSLTIAALRRGELEVNLIPLTRERTTLGERRSGDEVNIETDIIARYIERFSGEEDHGVYAGRTGC